jgi:integrase
VFPAPEGGRLGRRRLQRRFAEAMDAAGIPKEHPELRLPRTFHSLRYSASVLMQRRGYHPRLIEATLGHGSLELTYGVYGGWTPDMLQAEAARDPDA